MEEKHGIESNSNLRIDEHNLNSRNAHESCSTVIQYFQEPSNTPSSSSSSSLDFFEKDHDEEINGLDIGTINAERRKYLLEALQQLQSNDEEVNLEVESENDNLLSSKINHLHQLFEGASISERKSSLQIEQEDTINASETKKQVDSKSNLSSSNEIRQQSAASIVSSSNVKEGKKTSSSGPTKKPLFSLKFFKSNSSNLGPATVEAEISSRELDKIVVDSLPQSFLAKYLGFSPANGVHGKDCVRGPIDKLMNRVGKMSPSDDLPLVQIDVTDKGVGVKPHKKSRILLNRMFFPIDYVSSGIRDNRFCRVFSLVVVREISDKFIKTEAHCFVCASPLVAHRLYLSLSFAFRQMHANLEKHKERVFKINLSGNKAALHSTASISNENEEDV